MSNNGNPLLNMINSQNQINPTNGESQLSDTKRGKPSKLELIKFATKYISNPELAKQEVANMLLQGVASQEEIDKIVNEDMPRAMEFLNSDKAKQLYSKYIKK